MSYKKADLVIIFKRRGKISVDNEGKQITPSQINGLSVAQLTELVGEVTAEEQQYLVELAAKRIEYKQIKLDELKATCKEFGVSPIPSTKDQCIDAILEAKSKNVIAITLDEDQRKVLRDIKTVDKMCIHSAGPGCGKTTVIGAIVDQYAGLKILIVTYNKNAKNILLSYLRRFNVANISNEHLLDPAINAIHIYTIAGLQTVNATSGDRDLIVDDEPFSTSALNLDVFNDLRLDLLIVDEAQDISDAYMSLMVKLESRSRKVVVLGDPKQQLYGEPNWFLKRPPTNMLRYNHRSSVNMVNFINKYSRDNFTNSIEQIPTRTDIANEEPYVEINSLEELADYVKERKTKVYILAPVSFEKFNIDRLKKKILTHLHEACPGMHISLIGGSYPRDITECNVILSNIHKIKGSECNYAVIINYNIDYSKYNDSLDDSFLKRSMYVGISRAKIQAAMFNVDQNIIFGTGPIGTTQEYSLKLARIKDPISCSHSTYEGYIMDLMERTVARFKSSGIKPLDVFPADVIISVDIETDPNYITEISAVAYSIKEHRIIDSYVHVSKGVREFEQEMKDLTINDPTLDIAQLTALQVVNYPGMISDQKKIVEQFNIFIDKFRNYKILCWGGSDEKMLGIPKDVTINLITSYKSWLHINNMSRNNALRLKDAVCDLLGFDVQFAPHRAYYDALLTLAVGLCICWE